MYVPIYVGCYAACHVYSTWVALSWALVMFNSMQPKSAQGNVVLRQCFRFYSCIIRLFVLSGVPLAALRRIIERLLYIYIYIYT